MNRLVHGDDEEWNVARPQIAEWDASPDGRAVLGMVATGSTTPAHWLNNLEANTQVTASEMGGPALIRLLLARLAQERTRSPTSIRA